MSNRQELFKHFAVPYMSTFTAGFIMRHAANSIELSTAEMRLDVFFDRPLEREHFKEDMQHLHVVLGDGRHLGENKHDEYLEAFYYALSQAEGFGAKEFTYIDVRRSEREDYILRFSFEDSNDLYDVFEALRPLMNLDLYTQLWSLS